jgi:hypothetical protein
LKRKHEELDPSSDGDSEPEAKSECSTVWKLGILTPIIIWTDFTYQINVSSKTKDVRKVFAISSKTSWVNLEQRLAGILNVFTTNLCAQYVLSTEPAGAIPISLASQADLAELHEHLVPLVVPPRNANSSVLKCKMKEVLVRVTDKGNDAALSAASSNGKVGNKHCSDSEMTTKNLSRRGAKAENGPLQLHRLTTYTRRGLPFRRQSKPTGDVKHILLETDLCRAGGMASLHSAM